jgi:hypothetical protein
MSSVTIPTGTADVAKDLIEAHGGSLSTEETVFIASVKQWPNVWGECVAALVLQRSLSKHAEALNSAASASDRYARSLVKATWALVAATAALVIVGIIQMIH